MFIVGCNMPNSYISIKISRETFDFLSQMMIEDKYKSIQLYLDFLLKDKIAAYKAEKDGITLTADDEEKIKQRLRELGYL